VVGTLAAMTRAEAYECVVAAGARWADAPGPGTDLLVVGAAEPPLEADGELVAGLVQARSRMEAGGSLRVLSEQEFLELLGLGERGAPLRRLYTSAQLARILAIPQRRLRSWVRSGLIRPVKVVRRLSYFDFAQVSAARALSRLTDEGVTPRRIRASLEALARWWPETGAGLLGQLSALESGGPLLVRTLEGDLAETSGQLRLDFAGDEQPVAAQTSDSGATAVPESELWFQRALRHEEAERLEEAARAYARALDPHGPRAEVAFNLGNVLYALERVEDACAAFALATQVDPEYVEAWNNLGNALSRLGRHEEAREALERALALEPGYADAHFNLAETLAAAGMTDEARAHWRAYLEDDPDSSWAAEVRARLRRTDPG